MKKVKLSLIIFLTVLLTAGSIFADGGNRNGTAGASQLEIPVGTRGIAMGNATLTGATGVEALFWNPADLSRGTFGTDVMFSHMSHIADIGISYGAVGINLGDFGSLALALKSLDIGDIDKTTIQNPDGTGATFSPSFMTIGATFSKLLSDRIAVGITMNVISEKIELVSATGVAFNIGISYHDLANVKGLKLAFVIKNLGTDMEYEGSGLNVIAKPDDFLRPQQYYKIKAAAYEIPSALQMGLGYVTHFDEHQLEFAASFASNNYYSDEYNFGVEYGFNDLIFIRGGYTYAPDIDKDDRLYDFTAGFGINYDLGGVNFKVDYAFRNTQYFDNGHVFSVGVGL